MPVRSLNSAVLRWPAREDCLDAARRWASALCAADSNVMRIGCVGSAARGDWGVGSDLDLVVILRRSDETPAQRYARYYPQGLPVPADLIVYTLEEWRRLEHESPAAFTRLANEWCELAARSEITRTSDRTE